MSLSINMRPALQSLAQSLHLPNAYTASVLRLDAVHPVVSGNKWYKLKGYLEKAKTENKKALVTFGGAYSNHIIATAAACADAGIKACGIIRGEKPQTLSPTLLDALDYGMQLYFISREAYRKKELPLTLQAQFNSSEILIVPEGGYGPEGAAGAADILKGIDIKNFSYILCAVGTGTTLAGLVQCALPHQKAIGISALKNNVDLHDAVNALLPTAQKNSFTILHSFHFGGYAKHSPQLLQNMNDWYTATGIPSDFVYTGKLFAAFMQLCSEAYFKKESNILIIHSGGLQGNRSLPAGTLSF